MILFDTPLLANLVSIFLLTTTVSARHRIVVFCPHVAAIAMSASQKRQDTVDVSLLKSNLLKQMVVGWRWMGGGGGGVLIFALATDSVCVCV